MEDRWDNFSSSSSFQRPWAYDVFFSFRGKDTRGNVTGHLYDTFCQKGVRTFMDEKLEREEEISEAVIKGMEQSRISIVIFSKNYAYSTWCLDQLAKIMELRQTKGQLVIPVYYYVYPADVGYRRASFARAMARHEARFGAGSERVQRWKLALKKAAELSGWLFLNGYDESEYIEKITKDVIRRLKLFIVEANNLRERESLTTISEMSVIEMSVIVGDRWANSSYSSSSSSFQHPWKYDVYFSVRREDTPRNFASHLYKDFCSEGIDTFIVDKVERGEEIAPALFQGIERSRISIIIFSENYAFSPWCLDELVKIIENMKSRGQLVFPVFYRVDSSAVRHQKASFGKALAKHEARFGPERIRRWKWALREAAKLSGWHLEDGYKYEYIKQITKSVFITLKHTLTYSADLPGKQFEGFAFESLSSMDFRECEFLTTIPDMSTAQNLIILLLDFCINLVEIHYSVGFLGKLITLSARHCWKLEKFPHKIRLISLQHLDLHGNFSFRFFPEVLGKMENIRRVSLDRTAIKELPYSMGKLSGLRLLELDYCRISYLPRSMRMLTNLTEISMTCSPLAFKSLKGNNNFGKLRYCLVHKLNLERCDLLDKDLTVIAHCFPNTKYLDLSKNKFVSISACMVGLHYLEKLCLANCKLLEEIEGIPPNLVLLNATNCNRLTSESTNMLGLAHQESSNKRFEVKLPGTRIPECFNYYVGEGKMSFWFCQNFPDVALCLAFELEDDEKLEGSFYFSCDIWIQVNGLPILQVESYREFRTSPHVRLIHLLSYIDSLKNADLSEWIHVEIFWEVKYYQMCLNIARPGRVHIYGKEADMENISFKKVKILSISSNGGCSFSQTTHEDESEIDDNQVGDCSFSLTRPDYKSETYDCLEGDNKGKPSYEGKEQDLSIELPWHCARIDPIALVCENIWTKHDDFISLERTYSIRDGKCPTSGQANEPDTIWDPMEMEYQATCQKDQRNNRDKQNDPMIRSNKESQWRFSLHALISSLVSLCSSSSLNSP